MKDFSKMREQAREEIIEALENGFNGYYCDLHNEVFNTDYYIIGTYEAKQQLESIGVFEAIDKVQEYEKDNFGSESYTDFSNPEKIINMLYYVIGDEELQEMMKDIDEFDENWNNHADEEINDIILKQIKG